MTNTPSPPPLRKPLRLWPGVAAAVLFVVARYLMPAVIPGTALYGMMAGLVGVLAIAVWWLFFSRAPWIERIGTIVLMVVAVMATRPFVHRSIENGMMGLMLPVYAVHLFALALVAAVVVSRRLSTGLRRLSIVVSILLACGFFTLLRTDGLMGESGSQIAWRWTPTAEERLLAQTRNDPAAMPPPAPPSSPAVAETPKTPVGIKPGETATAAPPAPADARTAPIAPPATKAEAEWPGFRGRHRDSVIAGVRINTDWEKTPPVELWRRPIGPGWSSFAVQGDRIYTQEQRGEDEIVACYNATTGAPVWMHRDRARFYESNGGAGPRATPTLSNGRVYTLGATGIVNALDARTGAKIWSRDGQADTGAKPPGWGFAGSPLVIDDLVIVAVSGRLAGYEIATGHPRWSRPTRGGGYSSPHLAAIAGVTQVLLLSGGGITSVAPADGATLWEHTWELGGVNIVQPGFADNRDILITSGDAMGGQGIRRLAVKRGPAAWTVEERWTSRGLKPYFNDFVVHKGHAFGFDGSILSCVDIADGTRKWKGGRYGQGQMVSLPDQDLLLVLSEEGELALVRATSDQFTEVARFAALEGKTWNHPVLVGDVLYVRNGEEMAAFRLSLAGR